MQWSNVVAAPPGVGFAVLTALVPSLATCTLPLLLVSRKVGVLFVPSDMSSGCTWSATPSWTGRLTMMMMTMRRPGPVRPPDALRHEVSQVYTTLGQGFPTKAPVHL